MSTQNLITLQGLSHQYIPRPTEAGSNYIMQGSAEDRALDIYHLIFAPTHACNLRCKHCYLPDHVNNFIPEDVALRLIDEWSEIVLEERSPYRGIFHIKGGEPFVVPYIWNLIERLALRHSLHLMLTTNATFTDNAIFTRLRKCNDAIGGHVTIVVSLDGATEKTHSILRGKGQFAKTLIFLEGMRASGITTHLNCVLHSANIHEVSAYVDLAKSYGATQINFLSFVPRGIGASFREFQLPHIEVYSQIDCLYRNGDQETRALLAGSLPHIRQREDEGLYRTSNECVAAYRGMLYITPDGNVNTCPNIVSPIFSIGNVFKESLKGILDNLSDLYGRLKSYGEPYICTGEKILYEGNADSTNKQSLTDLKETLGPPIDKDDPSLNPPVVSYCYSRNY